MMAAEGSPARGVGTVEEARVSKRMVTFEAVASAAFWINSRRVVLALKVSRALRCGHDPFHQDIPLSGISSEHLVDESSCVDRDSFIIAA